jgi:hypothetical protein
MKRVIGLMAGAALAFGASAASALDLTPEVSTEFRTVVVEQNVAPATVDFEVAVDADVPDTVELHAVPTVLVEKHAELEGHRFFLADNRVVVVAPDEPKVVAVIED